MRNVNLTRLKNLSKKIIKIDHEKKKKKEHSSDDNPSRHFSQMFWQNAHHFSKVTGNIHRLIQKPSNSNLLLL